MTATTAPATCTPGHAAFCWDTATPAERDAFEGIYRHGYDWARAQGLDSTDAERYAAARAISSYRAADEDGTSHTLAEVPALAAKYPGVQ